MKLRFVVAGRPNKGKSSLVAALAHNDEIAISPQSRTTRRSERFDFVAGDERLSLIDTPGIQRPAKVINWLRQHAESTGGGADRRADHVAAFIADPANLINFPDEVDVLQAIMGRTADPVSTAIIYVVDGSVPYDTAYEDEMSILQWTGRPSIAVINPIDGSRYVAQWQAALNQYFKLVRVFNTHQDDLESQILLLEDLAHVDPQWRQPLGHVVSSLRRLAGDQARQSAEIAADLLDEVCRFEIRRKLPSKVVAEQQRASLEQQFQQRLRDIEAGAMDALQRLYGHGHSSREIDELIVPGDLFDTHEWAWWGLDRKRLALAGAGAGALAGVGADLLSAGLSLGAATTTGAIIGAAGAWFGADRLTLVQLRALPSGWYEAHQGPIRNANFPFVVLGRLLLFQRALRARSHARRDVLKLQAHADGNGPLAAAIDRLVPGDRKRLYRSMRDLARQHRVDDLFETLLPLFEDAGPA